MGGAVIWGSVDLDEDVFVQLFEDCEYPNEKFRHADHIRLAWIYIRRFGLRRAEERMATSIRRVAVSLGREERYHATMTKAWTRLVFAAYRATPGTRDFSTFIRSHLWLADKKTVHEFYSTTLLASDEARQSWVEPDLRCLPESGAAGEYPLLHVTSPPLAPTEAKSVYSLFPTGVAVAARTDSIGALRAMTVSSFVSVSLDPPLVLISVGKRASFLADLSIGDTFSINVLRRDQESMSRLFSEARTRSKETVAWATGSNGAPRLPDALASLECTLCQIDGAGDHNLILGIVTGSTRSDGEPLLRWRSAYYSHGFAQETSETKATHARPVWVEPSSHTPG